MAVYNAGGGGKAFYVGSAAPSNTSVIWIDTGNSYIAKVYISGSWIPLGSVWK